MPRLLWIGSPFFSDALTSCGWDAVVLHNFESLSLYGWRDLVRVAGFEPDVLVVADKSRPPFVLGMENFPCLTFFYSVDSHIHSWQPFYAKAFDGCLVSLRDHLPRFSGGRLMPERVWWSPAFAAAADLPEPEAVKEQDCVFVGSVNGNLPRRTAFLRELGGLFPGLCVTSGAYRQIYARARVVLNHCEHGDLNFRVFEALGCGCCLVTPRIGHGLTELFTEGEHMLCYTPEAPCACATTDAPDACDGANAAASAAEALACVRHLLAHPQEARRMRTSALASIDAGHRAQHRALAFTRHAFGLLADKESIVSARRAGAGALRNTCLRFLYLHWAEETLDNSVREAYLAAARGDLERIGSA